MTKRKIAIAIAAAALAGTCAIGGTLAWLTSSAQITNTFTMGNVKIALDEADLTTSDSSDRTSSNQTYTVYPGAIVEKDPQITVEAGSVSCYVYAWVNDTLKINGVDATNITVNDDWVEVDGVDTGTLYRYGSEPVADTNEDQPLTKIFDNIIISSEIEQYENEENTYEGNIEVKAFAIQSEGLSGDMTAADAEAVAHFNGN